MTTIKDALRGPLVEALSHAAWSEFNHDNDPFTDLPGESHNSEGWKRINEKMSKVLKEHGL